MRPAQADSEVRIVPSGTVCKRFSKNPLASLPSIGAVSHAADGTGRMRAGAPSERIVCLSMAAHMGMFEVKGQFTFHWQFSVRCFGSKV